MLSQPRRQHTGGRPNLRPLKKQEPTLPRSGSRNPSDITGKAWRTRSHCKQHDNHKRASYRWHLCRTLQWTTRQWTLQEWNKMQDVEVLLWIRVSYTRLYTLRLPRANGITDFNILYCQPFRNILQTYYCCYSTYKNSKKNNTACQKTSNQTT